MNKKDNPKDWPLYLLCIVVVIAGALIAGKIF